MDLRVFFKLKEKRFWWVDIIFYLMISFLLAMIFSYLIFLFKNYLLKKEIKQTITALETVGTEFQKEQEKDVLYYQKKIIAFNKLFSNHGFAYRVFPFLQENTLPDVWYKQFNLDKKNRKVEVIGEAKDMEIVSRQIFYLENSDFVESVGNLHTSLGGGARVQFNFNIVLKPKIFEYISGMFPEEKPLEEEKITEEEEQNKILFFSLLLNPEVMGKIDHTTNIISLEVPYGTDLTNIQPLIITSPEAEVLPPSGVAQDFSKPIVYRVTGKDGSTRTYEIKITILPPPEKTPTPQTKRFNWFAFLFIFFILVILGMGTFLGIQWLRKRSMIQRKKESEIEI